MLLISLVVNSAKWLIKPKIHSLVGALVTLVTPSTAAASSISTSTGDVFKLEQVQPVASETQQVEQSEPTFADNHSLHIECTPYGGLHARGRAKPSDEAQDRAVRVESAMTCNKWLSL